MFKAWEKHQQAYEFGAPPAEGGARVVCPKEAVLEYLAFCKAQVATRVPLLNLKARIRVSSGCPLAGSNSTCTQFAMYSNTPVS